MNKPHKHAELIKAWADGAEIEVKNLYGDWVTDETPNWTWPEYRIKHEPKPDIEEITSVYVNLMYQHYPSGLHERHLMKSHYNFLADMKLIYDGNTRELKSAEVLK
jgi:hypothetical protein